MSRDNVMSFQLNRDLMIAVMEDRVNDARKWLKLGADPNHLDEDETPLWWAKSGRMVRLLLRSGAIPTGAMLFGMADWDGLTALLDTGLHVNFRGGGMNTPLHFPRGARAAKVLLNYGADVNARNDEGDTPLHRFAANNYRHRRAVVRLLLAAGADPHAQNLKNQTPLCGVHSISAEDDRAIIGALLRAGADPNQPNLIGSAHGDLLMSAGMRPPGEPATLQRQCALRIRMRRIDTHALPKTLARAVRDLSL